MSILPGNLFAFSVGPQPGTGLPGGEKGAAVAAAHGSAARAASDGTVGALVAPQCLLTFSGGTAAVVAVWAGIERVFNIPHSYLVGFLAALGWAAVLLWQDLTDPGRAAEPRVPVRVVAAIVNVFVVFGAASSTIEAAASAIRPPVLKSASAEPELPRASK